MSFRALGEKLADYAKGLPDPKRFGDPRDLPVGSLVPWVVQQHDAERAGRHYDVRFGPDSLYSWATRKEFPQPGAKPIALYSQPLHRGSYADFEGELTSGYGKGKVSRKDRGQVLVTDASTNKIKFVVAHKGEPEMYTLVRMTGPPKGGTERTRAKQGGTWLMFNTTPTEAVPNKKVSYRTIPAEAVDKLFDPEYVMSHKIDGAAVFAKLVKNHVDVLSYRASATGAPIVHTQRLGLGAGKVDVPKKFQGTVLRGEAWGEQGGKAIPARQLGGILNSSVANALATTKREGISPRVALFGVAQHAGEGDLTKQWPIDRQRALIQEALQFLPQSVFHEPDYAYSEDEKRQMWERITGGKDPRTVEGVVGFPLEGGTPAKVKPMKESDVWIREIFPQAKGRLKGKVAGGFKYSLSPDPSAEIVGEVGTGFDAETKLDMLNNPHKYVGRMARVTGQEQFPSGAWRAPAYRALHEDYPLAKAAAATNLLITLNGEPAQ